MYLFVCVCVNQGKVTSKTNSTNQKKFSKSNMCMIHECNFTLLFKTTPVYVHRYHYSVLIHSRTVCTKNPAVIRKLTHRYYSKVLSQQHNIVYASDSQWDRVQFLVQILTMLFLREHSFLLGSV